MDNIANPNQANTGQKATVLLIEDDLAIRRLLSVAFSDTEFKLIEAGTGNEGVDHVVKRAPDLVLLDLNLPDIDGLAIVKLVRSWSQVPIIILSARGQEAQKVECLTVGADDYITKPFGVDELIARVRVAVRRVVSMAQNGEPVFESGHLKIDFAARRVFVLGEEVKLSPLEYKLLTTLTQHVGKVVTHRQLLTDVWGPEYAEDTQYLRVYMGYLRKKIDPSQVEQPLLATENRVGYRLIG